VVLAGPTTNVEGVLSAFDFFCLASNAEGFPNVVGEAMACERPCIVTDVGDSARIVGDTGWIVPRNDLNQLAQAIMAACRVPHCEHRARGIAARQRIVERFSVEVAGAAYWDLYQGLLSPPERAPAPN
jgi:glycosyltransferase involved in cell wall biosynthesis